MESHEGDEHENGTQSIEGVSDIIHVTGREGIAIAGKMCPRVPGTKVRRKSTEGPRVRALEVKRGSVVEKRTGGGVLAKNAGIDVNCGLAGS